MIPFSDVSLVAVVIATIANIAVGFLWYSPAMFAKRWMALVNMSEKDMGGGMATGMAIAFPATLLCVYFLGVIMAIIVPQTLLEALMVTLLCWFSFAMPTYLSRVAWEQSSWQLFWINSLGALAAVLVSTAILFFLS